MVECYLCGETFEPSPERVKAWAESGRDFDPTDWECKRCDDCDEALQAFCDYEMAHNELYDDGDDW